MSQYKSFGEFLEKTDIEGLKADAANALVSNDPKVIEGVILKIEDALKNIWRFAKEGDKKAKEQMVFFTMQRLMDLKEHSFKVTEVPPLVQFQDRNT